MDALGTRDLRSLTQEQSGPCVSIYLPTHVGGENGQQDPVRLKNLLQSAEQQLAQTWLRPADARRMLQAARDLPGDAGFWEARGRGLAIFITPEAFSRYRLLQSVHELVLVGKRYYLKPLLPLFNGSERFFVLSLSQNRARLLRGSRGELQEVQVEGLPAGMKEALNYTVVDRGAQAHSAMQGGLGKQGAVFHSQGGQAETHKEDIATYFRLIDLALQPVLRDRTQPAPARRCGVSAAHLPGSQQLSAFGLSGAGRKLRSLGRTPAAPARVAVGGAAVRAGAAGRSTATGNCQARRAPPTTSCRLCPPHTPGESTRCLWITRRTNGEPSIPTRQKSNCTSIARAETRTCWISRPLRHSRIEEPSIRSRPSRFRAARPSPRPSAGDRCASIVACRAPAGHVACSKQATAHKRSLPPHHVNVVADKMPAEGRPILAGVDNKSVPSRPPLRQLNGPEYDTLIAAARWR